ncbi:amino acid permease [Thiotrichales bacterium 19S9-12]|nr:amino acid permease [Thiotrichales bacterium 19S9-11]MCF6811365.1 amino acid permease [Thiotrichales bacterium 19S9-12]
MQKASIQRQFGSIMIVIGTQIGAGILAIPIITAELGFPLAFLLMIISWLLMTYTAILVSDIALHMPKGTSFGRMAKLTLGTPGAVISWLSFLLLLYTISVAYISAAASAFGHLLPSIPHWVLAILFVAVFASVTLLGTSSVDWVNRILLSIKLLFLLLACFTLFGYIELPNLSDHAFNGMTLLLAIPVLITSFTSHLIVPPLVDYLNRDKKAIFRVMLIGSSIPLTLYILWEIAVLGTLPLNGPISFMESIFSYKTVSNTNIGDVLSALSTKIGHADWAKFCINVFTDISVMTSYLGVSLAFYHFVRDSFRLNHIQHPLLRRSIGIILCFAAPLSIVIFYPNLFVTAISYVGVFVAIMFLLLPILMAFKLKHQNIIFNYRLSQLSYLWLIVFVSGIIVIICQILS